MTATGPFQTPPETRLFRGQEGSGVERPSHQCWLARLLCPFLTARRTKLLQHNISQGLCKAA